MNKACKGSLLVKGSKVPLMTLYYDEPSSFLGCHTRIVANCRVAVPYLGSDIMKDLYSEAATAGAERLSEAGGFGGGEGDSHYTRYFNEEIKPLIKPGIKAIADSINDAYKEVTHVIMSDSVGLDRESSLTWDKWSGVATVTAEVIEALINNFGWACLATPVASNFNYHSTNTPHLVQTFILTGPSAAKKGVLTRSGGFRVGYPEKEALSVLLRKWASLSRGHLGKFLRGKERYFKGRAKFTESEVIDVAQI